MEGRVLGSTVSPGSPELFFYSCQALARFVLLLDLQARVIYLPPHSGWGQGPGPAGQGKCLCQQLKDTCWSTHQSLGPCYQVPAKRGEEKVLSMGR